MEGGEQVDTVKTSLDLQSSADLIMKFESLAKSFEDFEDSLISRKATRNDTNERRMQGLLHDISMIESNLAKESHVRQESLKSLENMFQTQLEEMKKHLEESIEARFSELSSRLSLISNDIRNIDDKVEEDRVAFPKEVEQRSHALTSELTRFKELCQTETAVRQQHEKKLRATIDDDCHSAAERFKAQRYAMEQKQMALEQEITFERRVRQKDAESLLEQTKATLKELKASLEQCNHERVRSMKEIVRVMTHYTAALQDGVNIVSQSAGL